MKAVPLMKFIFGILLVIAASGPMAWAATSLAQVQAQVDKEYAAGYMNSQTYNDVSLALKNMKTENSSSEHPYDAEAFKLIVSAYSGSLIQADAASRILA